MKKILIVIVFSYIFGFLIGNFTGHYLWPQKSYHVCQCERCKIIRQLETIELLDSIISELK